MSGDADALPVPCVCGHGVKWHHESRGCGYYGFSDKRSCPCRRDIDASIRELIDPLTTELAAAREALGRVRELAEHWATDPHSLSGIGNVADVVAYDLTDALDGPIGGGGV